MEAISSFFQRLAKNKLLAVFFTLYAIVTTIFIVRELVIKLAIFPLTRGLAFPFLQFITLGIILFISHRNVWVKTAIISMGAFLLSVINSVVMFAFYRLADAYIRTVIAQPTYIEYTYDGAISGYKLLIYICFIIAFILWLRFILIIRHNLLEQ